MGSSARHIQYRKSIYRKKRIKVTIIISLTALALAFAMFLIIGTALHNKTSGRKPAPDEGGQTDATTQTQLPAPQVIGGYALPLLKDGSTFSERLSAIPDNAAAVSIDLNKLDGELNYQSSVSSKLNFISCAHGSSSLPGLISRAANRELYVSAILYIPSFSEEDDLLKDVYISGWCSVAVEAIRSGADDCIIIPRSASTDDVDRICNIASAIRQLEPEAILGCSIPEDVLTSEGNEVPIAKLSKSFNFLAIDTSGYKEGEDVETYIETRISKFQMQLIYYKMRVLLPYSDNIESTQKYIDIATKYNITSWQIKP